MNERDRKMAPGRYHPCRGVLREPIRGIGERRGVENGRNEINSAGYARMTTNEPSRTPRWDPVEAKTDSGRRNRVRDARGCTPFPFDRDAVPSVRSNTRRTFRNGVGNTKRYYIICGTTDNATRTTTDDGQQQTSRISYRDVQTFAVQTAL